jgi:recombination protein RecA
VIGNRTRVKVVKNKLAAPFREAEFDILYGEGTSREGDLLDVGVQNSVIEKSGSWFSYRGERIGQGRDNARAFLKEHPELALRLDQDLRGVMKLSPVLSNPAAAGANHGHPQAELHKS